MSPSEQTARKVAEIIGPASSAAQALKELERRRQAGEQADIAIDGRRWIVYSIPPEEMGT